MPKELDEHGNVVLRPGFTQVCVWRDMFLGEANIESFVAHMRMVFKGTEVQYLEEILTNSEPGRYGPVKGTGNRNDLFFAIRNEDIGKFAVKRHAFRIVWVEQMFDYGHGYLYPERVARYCGSR